MLPMGTNPVINRRTFTAGVAALLATPGTAATAEKVHRSVIAGATRRPDGTFAAVIYDFDKGLLASAALPARGHDVTINPITKECVAFARRPGTFAVAFGIDATRPPVAFTAPAGRHFYGHGVFSRDGRLLYTTENDFQAGVGRIGVWDATAQYKRVGEFPSHGIGPHDLNVLRDGRTLVVANGGIVTHPDHGRRPLNLPTMQPSLTYIDRMTGDLVEQHVLPSAMHKLSIRHLDVATNDTIVFGCQHKGPRHVAVNLIGFHRRGEEIALLNGGPAVHRALRQYVSSIAIDCSGQMAAVTSSRGQQVVLLDVDRRAVVGLRRFADVSGVAANATDKQFIITSGSGQIARVDLAAQDQRGSTANWSWDNHVIGF